MRNIGKLGFVLTLLVLIASCKKDEKTPAENLEGKWIITSQELLATVTAGDGSYLTFGACSSTCSGTDYKASDQTTGSFTYVLNEDATQLSINDQLTAGGNYNYVWDILELNETNLRMTASTILGNLKIEMTKE